MVETKIDPQIAVGFAKTLVEKNKLNLKILKCAQTEQGLTFYYLTPERSDLRPLSRDLNRQYKIKISFKELSPQEAADLIPGYASCGHRLSWLSDACGNLWDCTCDPTADNKKVVPTPERSKSSDLSGENETSRDPSEISENHDHNESRVGERVVIGENQPAIRERQSPKKKLIRRLVLK